MRRHAGAGGMIWQCEVKATQLPLHCVRAEQGGGRRLGRLEGEQTTSTVEVGNNRTSARGGGGALSPISVGQ